MKQALFTSRNFRSALPPFFVLKRVDRDRSGAIGEMWAALALFVAWAEFDDMLDGLGVKPGRPGSWSGCVDGSGLCRVDEGVACDEADNGGGCLS